MKVLTKRQAELVAQVERRTVLELRDPTTTDQDRSKLEDAMLALIEDKEDFQTLGVRRGVSFDGYEVFLRDRMLTVKTGLVEGAIKNGTLPKLAQSYINRLLSRLFTGEEPVIAQYRVIDVERERLAELEDLLRTVWGEEKLKAFLESVPLEATWRPMSKVRILRGRCIRAILEIMLSTLPEKPADEKPKAKKGTPWTSDVLKEIG